MTAGFSTIHFYIILKRMSLFMISGYVSVPYIFTSFSNITPGIWWQSQFQYHTFLHHSQTLPLAFGGNPSFSTIHFYIILKHSCVYSVNSVSFSTIHFYIILKRAYSQMIWTIGFSTIHFYIILKPTLRQSLHQSLFQYHTFLHHSQT